MRGLLFFLAVAWLLSGCGGGTTDTSATTPGVSSQQEIPTPPPVPRV